MEANINVFYLVVLYYSAYIIGLNNAQILLSAVLLEPILLKCCHESRIGTQWIFNKNLLYLGRNSFDGGSLDSRVLLPNNSLFIEHVTLNHAGEYECICSSSSVVSYYLDVEGLFFPLLSFN